MLLASAVFLFNVLCGLVPCTPRHKIPELMPEPVSNIQLAINLENEQVQPIVQTQSGLVEGYLGKSTKGRVYFAFEGIPYGESTGGANRWRLPVPKRPWKGVRHAKKPGSPCVQLSLPQLLRVYGSEDCLSVNVYTPNLPGNTQSDLLPVLVFIHGGSFIFGTGMDYGAAYLLNEGVMGFLSTGDKHLPGNYGLHDQALALKWVHENIERFGGNKENVTLMGQSAGAVAVHLHLISNKTRDYFNSAVSCSGNGLLHWGVQTKDRMRLLADKLGSKFGCRIKDSAKFVECMRRVNSNLLEVTQLQLFDWFPFPPVLLSPIVEPEHPDAFLTIHPEEAYRKGVVARKPYIMGSVRDEGKASILFLLALMRTIPLRLQWNQIAPIFLQYYYLVDDPKEVTKKIEKFYLNGTLPRDASLDVFGEMVTDRYLMFGIVKGMQAQAAAGGRTFAYQFSFTQAKHSMANLIGRQAPEWGVGHAEDLFYFFNSTTVYDGQRLSDPEAQISSIMVKLLVNFAKTGEPVWTTETGEIYRIWEPLDNSTYLRVLRLDTKVEMMALPENQINRLNFWNELNFSDMTLWAPLKYSDGGI